MGATASPPAVTRPRRCACPCLASTRRTSRSTRSASSPRRSRPSTSPARSRPATRRLACRATKFNFKVGKETGGKKMDNPHSLKSNEMAEVVFVPQQPLVVDSFKNCEGLSRIAFLDGNTAVMLGKVTTVVAKSDMPAEEVKAKKK